MPFLKHTDDRVVGNTIEGLEGIQSEKCVAIFSQLLVHKSNRVKANAAKALSRFDKESTLPILTEMLQMKDKPHYVISACFAAKELKEDSLLDYLNPLLDDDLTFADALKAIEAYGSKAAVDTLQTAMGFTEDADKKAAIEESIKRIKSGKNASPTTQQSSHNSKSNDAARQASAAAKLAVKTLASKVEEIPQSYFDAIKELYNDPFKGQEKAIGILNEKETQITGGILALLLPLSGLFIAFWYLPPMLKTTEFYFRALILFLLFPVSFIAAFAIIGSTITAENPGKDVAIFAGGLALVPAAIALVICGLIGPGNIELSLIFAVYGLLATFMNVQASLTYLYKMPTYKCMLLSPAIFVIAGYIFKVLLFTIIPSGPHHPY